MSNEMIDLNKFLRDETKENLVVYELELNKIKDPNEELWIRARSQGDFPCRLWLILFLTNLSIATIITFLILLLLIEIGPVAPYQSYGQQCVTGYCDSSKGLVCGANGGSKTCQCPTGNWFWYNQQKCRECPPNWLVANDGTGCYFVSQTRLNYTDANLWCEASQGCLLEISNNNLFIALQAVSRFNFRLKDFYWIGLRETGPNQNTYRWVTSGTSFPNSNYFCSGQPAHSYNYYFQQYDQCVGLSIQSNTSTCLSDSTCPNAEYFICELY